MKYLLILTTTLLSLNAFSLYEEDSRKDLYKVENQSVRKVAQALAYQIEKVELRGWTFNRFWTLVMKPFHEQGICSNERFSDNPSMRTNCTWILVSPKHLLSAGNCITEHYCKNDLYYYMFNYHLDSALPFNEKHSKTNFYQCKNVVKRVFDPATATSYALIELKKEVKGITPVKISLKKELPMGQKLIVLGHIQGMPLKIADDNQVFDQNEKHFLVNSDIAGETKGSAVINAQSYELEGLLIHGTKNYEHEGGGCKTAPVYPNNLAQELALRSAVLKDLIKSVQ
jgi:V8-like Glu-specific endopeptidase